MPGATFSRLTSFVLKPSKAEILSTNINLPIISTTFSVYLVSLAELNDSVTIPVVGFG